MKTYNIFTNKPDSLPEGKADFLLGASVTNSYDVEGITPLIPILDAEFISTQKLFSMPTPTETSNNFLSPSIITRAVENLNAFSSIEILNLGLERLPQQTQLHDFDIKPSQNITQGANIDAKEVLAKGMAFGKNYELKGSYLILGESTFSGTQTAVATTLALGYSCKTDVKVETINTALALINDAMSNFEKLSIVSDNILIFCAGFLLEASRRFHIVLSGGIEMAACLLVADKLREDVLMRLKPANVTLATTSWVVNEKHSDIKHFLEQLSYTPHAIYTDFSFANTEIPILNTYDKGKLKDGVGAGAAIAYASSNEITNQELLDAIELIIYMM